MKKILLDIWCVWFILSESPWVLASCHRFVTFIYTSAPSGVVIKSDFLLPRWYLHPSFSLDSLCESFCPCQRQGRIASPM